MPGHAAAAAGDDASSGEDGVGRAAQTAQMQAPAGVTTTRQIPMPNLSGVTPPPIICRSEWGADESLRIAVRAYAPIRKLVVHHTASGNHPYDPAEIVRIIYRDHVGRRGFADIGYNFLIDNRGRIYEGRYSRRYGDDEPVTGEDHAGWGVVGAHAKTMNAGTCGICLIGNFDLEAPTNAAIASLQCLLAWKASRQRIDAGNGDPFVNVYGSWGEFGNIAGHRNVGETLCPGKHLYALLPALRQNVAGQAGRWNPLIADIPRLMRYDWTFTGQGPLTAAQASGAGTSSSGTSASGTNGSSASGTSGTTGTGPSATVASAYRAVTDAGQVFTVGKADKLGQPGSGAGAVVAMANPGWGDGYLTLSRAGTVTAFGALTVLGDVSGKQDGDAVDLAVSATGAGYWILMANGGIYPFGDARYFSSPRRAALGVAPVRMAARPQHDGYWVLLADGSVRGFGAAASLGGPGTATGVPVDLAPTASGAGYWVLLDTGEVAAFGDAPAKGGMASKNVRWAKPAAAIERVGADGYVISARDGGLYTFNGAPYFGSFAGSGAHVVGIAPAARA